MGRDDTRRQMTALVRRWAASGETQAVFAQRHGVSLAKLRYWVPRATPSSGDAVTFAPVQVRDATRAAVGTIEVALASGARVVIEPGAAKALVRTVLSALTSC